MSDRQPSEETGTVITEMMGAAMVWSRLLKSPQKGYEEWSQSSSSVSHCEVKAVETENSILKT